MLQDENLTCFGGGERGFVKRVLKVVETGLFAPKTINAERCNKWKHVWYTYVSSRFAKRGDSKVEQGMHHANMIFQFKKGDTAPPPLRGAEHYTITAFKDMLNMLIFHGTVLKK